MDSYEITLSRDEMAEALAAISEILWPDGDRLHEWKVDDLDRIAEVFDRHGLMPPADPDPFTELADFDPWDGIEDEEAPFEDWYGEDLP